MARHLRGVTRRALFIFVGSIRLLARRCTDGRRLERGRGPLAGAVRHRRARAYYCDARRLRRRVWSAVYI